MALLTVLALASPWPGWLFSIGEGSVYGRGPMYALQLLLTYVYLAVSFLSTMLHGAEEKNPARRREIYQLTFFVALPMLGGVLQALLCQMPILLLFTTLSLVILYGNLLEEQISRDPLTGLHNRRKAMDYLKYLRNGGQDACFMLADLNDFKTINDRYGHPEGIGR